MASKKDSQPLGLAGSAGAAPFVPGTPASASTPAGNFKVSAMPFVPGGGGTPAQAPGGGRGPQGTQQQQQQQLGASAQPFVPSVTRPGGTPGAGANQAPASGTPVPAHVKQSNNAAGSPHRGRAAAGLTPASPAAPPQPPLNAAAAAATLSPPMAGRGMAGRGGRGSGVDHASHGQQQQQGGRGRGAQRPAAFPSTSDSSYPSSPGPPGMPSGRGGGVGALNSPALSPVPPRLPGYRPLHAKVQPLGRIPLARQFLDEKLKQQLAAAAYTIHAQWSNASKDPNAGHLLPERIASYHTLLPLDHASTLGHAGSAECFSHALGLRTMVVKGVSSVDGQAYALRRVDGKQVIPSADVLSSSLQAVDAWSALSSHPHLVALRAAFVSSEVEGVSALFFVYDFHPGCVTLAAAHLAPAVGAGGMVTVQPPSEASLWSYLVQLTSVMRAAHMHGLVLRPCCLHATKILVSPTGKLRVNCCGLLDGVAGDVAQEREDLAHAQRMDLTALGQLMLSLACAGLVPPGHAGSLELLGSAAGAARVSPELCRLIAALLAAADGGMLGSVRQLCSYPAMVEHTMQELEAGAAMSDMMMNELSKECENGRLLRLLIKLGFVVERPQGDVDGSWAETGDRYLLKLFRDFVFHQRVPEGSPGAGGPLLDWGYVVEALNKLDAGVPERIMLLARDEAAMLIASYADIKRCVENAYADLHTRMTGQAANKGLVGS